MKNKNWEEEDKEYLIENYDNESVKDLVAYFGRSIKIKVKFDLVFLQGKI